MASTAMTSPYILLSCTNSNAAVVAIRTGPHCLPGRASATDNKCNGCAKIPRKSGGFGQVGYSVGRKRGARYRLPPASESAALTSFQTDDDFKESRNWS